MLGKFLLAAFISLSIRTPKEAPDVNPIDYHMAIGIETSQGDAYYAYERENGSQYHETKLLTKPTKTSLWLLNGWQGEIHIKEANEINRQYLFKEVITLFERIEFRAMHAWEEWEKVGYASSLKVDLSGKDFKFVIQHHNDLNKFYSTHLDISNVFALNEKSYIEPKFTLDDYRKYNGRLSYQFRLEYGIAF